MREDLTHITVILDRTGSMEAIRNDTIGGFNAFLDSQRNTAGRASLTLVQFDSEDPFERVHHFLPLPLVPRLTRETFVPRGATPLLDAMGRGILDLDGSLEALGAAERPGRIVFVVVTDGEENSSREFTHARVRALIEERRESHGWQFVFLSADMAAIADARATGFMASSTLAFSADSAGSQMAWGALSDSLSAYRENRLSEMTLEPRPDKS